MTTHRDIYAYLNQIAPYETAEDWDPSGPTIGWLDDKTKSVVLSLDLTSDAHKQALDTDSNLIITHHPYIFSPINQILAENFEQGLLLKLAKHRISVISCHTNLDAAKVGVATSFVETALDKNTYSTDLEILIPHLDNPDVGHGRLVVLNQEKFLSKLLHEVEHNLKSVIQVNTDTDRLIKKIVFTPGAFDESWISEIQNREVELLITGEIKHHATVMLNERGIAVFAAGHGASEQTVIPLLQQKLTEKYPEIIFVKNRGITYNQLRSE